MDLWSLSAAQNTRLQQWEESDPPVQFELNEHLALTIANKWNLKPSFPSEDLWGPFLHYLDQTRNGSSSCFLQPWGSWCFSGHTSPHQPPSHLSLTWLPTKDAFLPIRCHCMLPSGGWQGGRNGTPGRGPGRRPISETTFTKQGLTCALSCSPDERLREMPCAMVF